MMTICISGKPLNPSLLFSPKGEYSELVLGRLTFVHVLKLNDAENLQKMFDFLFCHQCVSKAVQTGFLSDLIAQQRLVVYCGGSSAMVYSGGAPIIPNRLTISDLLQTLKWENIPDGFVGGSHELVRLLLDGKS